MTDYRSRSMRLGGVPRVHGAEAPGYAQALTDLGGVEEHEVVLVEAPGALVLDLFVGAQELDGAGREVELAADVKPCLDAFFADDARDLRHGGEQRTLLVDDGLPAVRLRGTLARAGEGGVTPAAVTPRGLEAAISFSSTATRSVGSAFLR